MSGRDIDQHRIREARQHVDDVRAGQTVNAFDAIARGNYKSDRAEHQRPDGETWERSTPEYVRAALERSRIVPLALSRPCPDCGAPAGMSCARAVAAVCGTRAQIGARLRAEATP